MTTTAPTPIAGELCVLFGIITPPPTIPGYQVILRDSEFAKAICQRTSRAHYIRDSGHSWELWPCRYDGRRTPRNPRGEYAHHLDPIIIPKQP